MIRTKEKAPVKSRGRPPSTRAEAIDMIAKSLETRPVGRPPSGKIMVNLRLDPEVVARFKATGKGWQARMNDALRKAMP